MNAPDGTATAPIVFGTDGVRGRVPEAFNLALLTQLGKGVCSWLLDEGASGVLSLPGVPAQFARPFAQRILVGYDRRPDSAEFALPLAKVCAAYGFEVGLTPDFAPTPAIALAARDLGFDCALIVTASHNQYTDNGLKLKPSYGGSATSEITNRVEAAVANPVRAVACATSKSNAPQAFDVAPHYLTTVRELLQLGSWHLPGVTIQFDAMHGATTGWLQRVVEGTDLVVNALHEERATHATSLHPEPLAQWLTVLTEAVGSTPGSVGIACDGDGDRLGLVDEQGRFLSSQVFYPLILLSRLKLGELPVPAIAKTFSGTMLLDRIGAKYGLTVREVPVGYKHISLMLAEGSIAMGGEESGGLGFVEFIPERDGVYSGLMTLSLMARRGMTLAALHDELMAEVGPVTFFRRDLALQRVVTRDELQALMASASKSGSFAGEAVERVESLDGVKFWFSDGWLLLRPSGTEALIRLYCEHRSEERMVKLLAAAVALVSAPEHGLVAGVAAH
ncbi:MAG: hypothetical protein ABI743_00450 [bacterium]